MKKLVLLFTASLMLGGAAFAQEDSGALGFGILSDSSEKGLVGGGIRGSIFLDAGSKLAGPFYYGFEFQGDAKKMAQNRSDFQQTDATAFQLSQSEWLVFISQSSWSMTVTRWDLDFSPRGYLSFQLMDSIQLLGFAGLNYNWTTFDYTLKNTGAGTQTFGTDSYTAGEEKTESNSLEGVWDVIAGFRVSVGAFYGEYTRFLKPDASGDYSWNKTSKNRLGFGINLRF